MSSYCILFLFTSCDYYAEKRDRPIVLETLSPLGQADAAKSTVANEAPIEEGERRGLDGPVVYHGNNSFIRRDLPLRNVATEKDGKYIFNFEKIDLRDVVHTVLGTILKVNYSIDPRIQGIVNMEIVEPLPRDAVLPTLELILRQNGAALIEESDIFRIVPAAEAIRGKGVDQIGGPDPTPIAAGYNVLVMPLRYISALQLEKILEPLVPLDGALRVDIDRNLVIIAGSSQEVAALRNTASLFDVDWLKGMSVGLFPLVSVNADRVAQELEVIFGDPAEGPLAGLIRMMPIERLNALLVVSPRAELIDDTGEWIKRLDRGAEAEVKLYVYYVQTGKAVDLATLLNEIFAGRESNSKEERRNIVAPGRTTNETGTTVTQQAADEPPPDQTSTPPPTTSPSLPTRLPSALRRSEGLTYSEDAEIRIIADEITNALLILATPRDYRMVLSALRKLDIVPLQVMIDATVADVTLTESLRYGVQSFLSSGNFDFSLSQAANGVITPIFPGFNIARTTSSANIVVDALENVTDVKILSSPRLMVLDNQTARLQVGDEVPVITQQQQSTDAGANLVNNIQFRETGVILNVTPRVSGSGLVTLEIEQEVSNVSSNANTGQLTPTIAQRRIKSSIAIQSGTTVLLGGLIEESKTAIKQGIPFLSQIPILGSLFGNTNNTARRTELIVLLTPRVIRDQTDAIRITDEIRRRMRNFANPTVKVETNLPARN